MVVFKIVEGAKKHFYYRLSEWVLTCCLGIFAVVLLAPWDTFDSSHGYSVLQRWGTESQWGWVIAFFVLLRLSGLILNGTVEWFAPYSPLVRCVCSMLCVPIWFSLALGFSFANPLGAVGPEHFVWTLGEAFVASSIARDAAVALRTGGRGGRTP